MAEVVPGVVRPQGELLVGGVLRPASDGATAEVENPATAEVIGTAPDATADDVDAAVGAARTAFDETDWSRDHELRAHCLTQLHEALRSDLEDLRETTIAEVGATRSGTTLAHLESPVGDIPWVIDLLRSYDWTTDLGVREPYGYPSNRTIHREAAGVVAAITPWNFPNQINLAKLVPALAAGCTTVLKPAPLTPWTALFLGRLIAERTDIPAGVVNVVTPSSNDVAATLTTDPRIDMVTFTGSTAVGRTVMANAAATVKKVFLELGGKSACIILDDADVATEVAFAAFQTCYHAGQGCALRTRVLVPRSRYDEAVEAGVAGLAGVPYGDPLDPGNWMGPVISKRQRDRILEYVRIGEEAGAKVAIGGKRAEQFERGWWVEPTLLVDVTNDMRVAQEEIFGPVLCLIPFDDDDDAVRIANDSIYGLSGRVCSGDEERAMRVAQRLRTGTVDINDSVFYAPDVPFGGYKQSGIGREMGRLGFEEYTEVKVISTPAR